MMITLLSLFSSLSSTAFAADYVIDPAHTRPRFEVSHMMVTTVEGTFSGVTGSVSYDPANVSATKIDVKIPIATVDTREPDRDAHLKSPDFFDAEKYPDMTFVSTGVKDTRGPGFDVTGNLTIHGVTKPVVLHVEGISTEIKDPWGNTKVGGRATTTINRQDFGVSWNKDLDGGGYVVGDEVEITIDFELNRKP